MTAANTAAPALPIVEIVETLPTRIWIESDLFGARHVVLQHEGCEPFDYASFAYDRRYTDNAGTWAAARQVALALGATEPIEQRTRMPAALEQPAAAVPDREVLARLARETGAHAYTNRFAKDEPAFAFSIDKLERFAAALLALQPAKPLGAPVAAEHAEELMRLSAQAEALHTAQQPAAMAPDKRLLHAGAALACAAHNLGTTGECHLQADAAVFGRLADEWRAAMAAAPAAQPLSETERYWLQIRSQVIDALREKGMHIMSNRERVWVDRLPGAAAQAAAPVAQPVAWQGGMSNAELLAAWERKLPGVVPSIDELTAFALGVEVGAAPAAAQPARQPLTTSQVWMSDDIMGANGEHAGLTMDALMHVVSAVERAHGIGAAAPAGEQQHG